MKRHLTKMLAGAALFFAFVFPGAVSAAPQSDSHFHFPNDRVSNEYEQPTEYEQPAEYASDDAAANESTDMAVNGSAVADNIIATGKQFLGVPYEFGAESGRTDKFDCSSFTQYVFKQNGIELPRSSRQQAKEGTYVPKDQLQKGDLIFSDTNRDGEINHVSIYMGDNQLLHTYRVGVGVTISEFEGSSWDNTYVTARRVIE